MTPRLLVTAALAIIAGAGLESHAADAYPSRPIRVLVPFVAGDSIAAETTAKSPNKLSYGSAGPGTSSHPVGELLANAAKIARARERG